MKRLFSLLVWFVLILNVVYTQKLTDIKDPDALWEQVQKLDNKPSYNSFVRRFPEDNRVAKAKKRIIQLYKLDKEKWENVKASAQAANDIPSSIKAYQSYLMASPAHPYTAYRYKANAILDSLAEKGEIATLISRANGLPGEMQLYLKGTNQKLQAEDLSKLYYNDQILDASAYFVSEKSRSAIDKPVLVLEELEAGNYQAEVSFESGKFVTQFIMPIRNPSIKLVRKNNNVLLVLRGIQKSCEAYLKNDEDASWKGPFALPNQRPIISDLKKYIPELENASTPFIRIVRVEDNYSIGEVPLLKENFLLQNIDKNELTGLWNRYGIWFILSVCSSIMMISVIKSLI